MEQLIIFAIIAIVSSIFGKSKNKKSQKSMPPFNNKDTRVESPVLEETPQHHQKPQSFEDFAREFIGDWIPENEKVQETKKLVEEQVTKEVPSYVAPPVIPADVPKRSFIREQKGRLAAGKEEVKVTGTHSPFQVPQSKNALMQAVVMAEILGPPKAKRK
ncbi:hypothetical protein [Lysinibacillus sphaericus]|uniref:hypothetical protein n=1 Tax=Lysinibacillus sphaericus TaxID=1421 RepID=UPI00056B3DE3|nr:hypothetical protein [Lysinibacillus sphaericus]MDM5351789.1 hypothetical protein [Lysinibacillus sphaericus]QTB21221.1 hypothetical protein J1907_15810 [Lysinibacillus sphaericus]QTB25749.1 hypothetical protein J2D51_15720 [Lysinibacillus sphaericus]